MFCCILHYFCRVLFFIAVVIMSTMLDDFFVRISKPKVELYNKQGLTFTQVKKTSYQQVRFFSALEWIEIYTITNQLTLASSSSSFALVCFFGECLFIYRHI
jgi:hypothetical protein